jgi:ribonuclease HI
MSEDVVTIHVDGAARGNPGPAAFAYVITGAGRDPVEHAERLGTATNNVAEYTALVRALGRARELAARCLAIFSDSELMVKQMNGEYRVKNPELKELYDEAQSLLRHFAGVTLAHVRRAENKRADQLCNEVLDGKFGRPPVDGRPGAPKSSGGAGKAARRVSVDEEAVECLRNAAAAWARGNATVPAPEMVWQQLWSILEEGGVLRTKKAK